VRNTPGRTAGSDLLWRKIGSGGDTEGSGPSQESAVQSVVKLGKCQPGVARPFDQPAIEGRAGVELSGTA